MSELAHVICRLQVDWRYCTVTAVDSLTMQLLNLEVVQHIQPLQKRVPFNA